MHCLAADLLSPAALNLLILPALLLCLSVLPKSTLQGGARQGALVMLAIPVVLGMLVAAVAAVAADLGQTVILILAAPRILELVAVVVTPPREELGVLAADAPVLRLWSVAGAALVMLGLLALQARQATQEIPVVLVLHPLG